MCTWRVVTNPYSRDVIEALGLIGTSIKAARIARRMSMVELSARLGISRQSLYRIERGDPGCAIGSIFEAALIVGVTLLETVPGRIAAEPVPAVEELGLHRWMIKKRDGTIDDEVLVRVAR